MKPTTSYWRDLLALIRGAPSNPLVMHQRPWRAGWVPAGFFVLQALAAGSVILFAFAHVALVHLDDYYSVRTIDWDIFRDEDALIAFGISYAVFGGMIGAIVLYPLNLLAYSTFWRDADRLRELVLTRLGPRELAAGSIFWGVAAGSMVPVAAFSAAVISMTGWFLNELAGKSLGQVLDDDMIFVVVLGLLLLETIPAACGVTLRIWFHMHRFRWPVLFLGPGLCAAWIAAVIASIGFAINAIEHRGNYPAEQYIACAWAALAGTTAMLASLRSAGKFAPSLALHPVLPHLYERASVVANSWRRLRDGNLRRAIRRAVREAVPGNWVPAAVSFGAAFAAIAAISWLTRARGRPETAWLNASVILAALPFATAAVLAAEHLRRGRLAFVSGALEMSLARRLFPIHALAIAFAAYFTTANIAFHAPAMAAYILEIVALMLFLIAVFVLSLAANVAAAAWWLSVRKWRVVRLFFYFIVPITIWFLFAVDISFDPNRRAADFWPATSPSGIAVLFLAGLLLLHRLLANLQALYDSTVRGTPPGTVVRVDLLTGERSTEEAPAAASQDSL